MQIKWLKEQIKTDMLLVLPVSKGAEPLGQAGRRLNERLGGRLRQWLESESCCAEKGETFLLRSCSTEVPDLLLLQLGAQEKLDALTVRQSFGNAARVLEGAKIARAAVVLDDIALPTVVAAYEASLGLLLGSYRFDCYKSKRKEAVLAEIFLQSAAADAAENQQALEEAAVLAAAVSQARDWINQPARVMTPARLAEEAQRLATLHELDIDVWEPQRMAAAGMGALLAVAQGSDAPPRLIVLRYRGRGREEEAWDAAFVGKGITFDSGGISLKPGEGMHEMKDDMSGAAAVLAAMEAVASLALPVNLLAVVPCAENMPSGKALKPGDVITAMDGQTIEVLNTDAEGRLVLADAVAYARKEGAQRIVDVATLTGACMVALGRVRTGRLGNDEVWSQLVGAAGDRAGEKSWPMPADEEYKELLKSEVADWKNIGGRYGGMITGGLFIGAFAGDTPWVHLDIAGTATLEKTAGHLIAGGSGVGVLTLVETARALAKR